MIFVPGRVWSDDAMKVTLCVIVGVLDHRGFRRKKWRLSRPKDTSPGGTTKVPVFTSWTKGWSVLEA